MIVSFSSNGACVHLVFAHSLNEVAVTMVMQLMEKEIDMDENIRPLKRHAFASTQKMLL